MQKKVDNILLQAETERSFFSLNKERFHVTAVLKEVMEEFRSRAEHTGGHIELEDTAGDPQIQADRYHLAGIMINLVDNAIKYSSSPPQVVIRVTESRGKIVISVADHGDGIDKKHHRRVFMPFFRVPSGNVHNVKGSGLGLSYVRKICDLHRWKVRLESEPGKGTTVSIYAPKLK
jgi:two-component system phosphate regulon sensor histidine kinase PhoR